MAAEKMVRVTVTGRGTYYRDGKAYGPGRSLEVPAYVANKLAAAKPPIALPSKQESAPEAPAETPAEAPAAAKPKRGSEA